MTEHTPKIGGVVLAGGLSTRMGEHEKSLLDLCGKPLVGHVIDRTRSQTDHLVINANGDASRFGQFNFPVIADSIEGYAGPLAGLLAGMQWYSKQDQNYTHVLSVAGDTPFLPMNLAVKLAHAFDTQGCDIALAYYDNQRHPTFGLWSMAMLKPLHTFLVEEGNRKIMMLVERHKFSKVEFAEDGSSGVDPFFNVNTPVDLKKAQNLAGQLIQ